MVEACITKKNGVILKRMMLLEKVLPTLVVLNF